MPGELCSLALDLELPLYCEEEQEEELRAPAEAGAAPPRELHGFRRRQKKAGPPPVDARAWQAAYPPACSVPLDVSGFCVSFACPSSLDGCAAAADNAAALAFWHAHGYVVFRDAISAAECAASREEVWDCMEREQAGALRNDPSTWHLLSSETYGLPRAPALFSRQLLANRQNPSVVAAFALLLRADASLCAPPHAGLLVSHDRVCLYRPTRAGDMERPEWRTRENLHLDLHPWAYRREEAQCRSAVETLRFDHLRDFSKETNWVNAATGPHLQGVLALADNAEADGGTLLVPGFAAAFDGWVDALGAEERHSDAEACAARMAGDDTRPWLIRRTQGGGSFKFAPTDPLCALARRVPVAQGCLLVWDQRMAHGARGNDSEVPRIAQFVKAFRIDGVSDARVAARARALEREARAAGSWEVVSELGRRVFGLDWPPAA